MTDPPTPRVPLRARGDLVQRLVRASIRRPRAVFGIWLAIAALAGAGLAHLEIDSSTGSFLDRSDPAWHFYQESLARYGGDEFVTIAVEGARAFDPAALRQVAALSEALLDEPGVLRVDSLSTVSVIAAAPGGVLTLEPPLATSGVANEAEAQRVAERLRGDRIAPRSLVSADGRVFAVNVLLDADVDRHRKTVVAAAERLIAGSPAWVSGVPVFRTKVNERTGTELALFVPLTLALVALVVGAAFRRLEAIVVSLAASGLGTAVALGAMGAVGVPLSLATVMLPSVLLAVGSAYTMHVLTASRGVSDPAALEAALCRVAVPVGYSGLTTAIGFLAMATVRIGAIRELGTYGAVGVIAALAASLTLGPAILRLRPLGVGAVAADRLIRGPLLESIVGLVTARPRAVLAGWALLVGLFSLGLPALRVETDIILWFPLGDEIRDEYEAIRTRLSGITPMNAVIESLDGTPVTEPAVLARIDALTRHLEGLPEIGRALSVADPLRQIHAGFEGLDDAGLPGDLALAEQYLLLLSSLDRMRDLVTDDRRSANVLLRVNVNGSRRLIEIADAIAAWWESHGAPAFSIRTTGIMYEFGRAEEEIAYGQMRGLGLAFLAIAVALLAILRSPLLAALALAPNVIPLLATYGFMGLAGVPLDAATVCMGSVALGIAVDDTLHVAVGFRDARGQGADPVAALRGTLHRVLPALLFTTVAVAIGFAVLTTSSFTLVRNFGAVTAGMVTLCLLADLTLLPVFLRAADARRSRRA